jgi:hypothetical protein
VNQLSEPCIVATVVQQTSDTPTKDTDPENCKSQNSCSSKPFDAGVSKSNLLQLRKDIMIAEEESRVTERLMASASGKRNFTGALQLQSKLTALTERIDQLKGLISSQRGISMPNFGDAARNSMDACYKRVEAFRKANSVGFGALRELFGVFLAEAEKQGVRHMTMFVSKSSHICFARVPPASFEKRAEIGELSEKLTTLMKAVGVKFTKVFGYHICDDEAKHTNAGYKWPVAADQCLLIGGKRYLYIIDTLRRAGKFYGLLF